MAEDERRARREWERHRYRWELLTELRQRRHELARVGDDRGSSLERARAAVAVELKKIGIKGSAATVRYSYELIEAAGGENATFESYQEELRRRRAEERDC